MHILMPCAHLAAILALAGLAIAQDGETAAPPAPTPAQPAPQPPPVAGDGAPTDAPEAEPAGDPPGALPGLDELLGIAPGQGGQTSENPAGSALVDPTTKQLERRLSGQEEQQLLIEAVTEMGDAAERLRQARDVGLQTQRLQQSVITKLDALIRSQQSRQSSSQQPQQQQNQDQQQGQQQASQQSQAQQQQNQQSQGEGDDAPLNGPAFEQGRTELMNAAAAAWGALPARVRDVLLESVGDRYSDLYRVQTEEYYRRLAEQEQR